MATLSIDDWVAIRDVPEGNVVTVYHEYVDPRHTSIDSLTLCGRTLDVATKRQYVGELRCCLVCAMKLAVS